MAQPSTRRQRFHDGLARRKWWIVAAFLFHCVVLHYFFLGYVSWDGFAHRMQPVIEIVKHGSMHNEKFDNWALLGYRPFVELIHAPFVWALGLDALYIAFPLTCPLFAAGVYLCVREASDDDAAALYAAGTYVLVPVVNSQLFSGYIDWAIPGLLAYFVYAVLAAARRDASTGWAAIRVALGTFLFTMSRQQAPYVSVLFLAWALVARFVHRDGIHLRVVDKPRLASTIAAYGLGLVPAAYYQVAAYLAHGSPIYPFELSFLGVKVGDGVSFKAVCMFAGLQDYTPRGFFRAFYSAWIAPTEVPHFFFDSRHLGGGLFFVTAFVLAPVWLRGRSQSAKLLVGALVLASLVLRDFWLPRYSTSLLLAVCVANGLALAALLRARARLLAASYGAFFAVTALHALRPEWELERVMAGDAYPRLNASNSGTFPLGVMDVDLYPDVGAHFVLLEGPAQNFVLQLNGRKLTNEVVGTISRADLGEHCEGLERYGGARSEILYVDDRNYAAACKRTCALASAARCLAYRIEPGSP
jgi:hypothetical protein